MEKSHPEKKLLLLFNHKLSAIQKQMARQTLNVSDILVMPDSMQELWANVPADAETIEDYIRPLKLWVEKTASVQDYILVQGDFGATYLMVNHAFKNGFVPIYATSVREASEFLQKDGSIKMEHVFRFVRFREYHI